MNILEVIKKLTNKSIDYKDSEMDLFRAVHKWLNRQDGAFDINKGFFIYGPVGVGKTTLLQSIQKYMLIHSLPSIHYASANDISSIYSSEGEIGIKGYKYKHHRIIDDVGQEDKSGHYGQKKWVINDLLMARYDLFLKSKKLTFISTNLTPDEFKELYGDVVADRVRQMCNIFEYPNKESRRNIPENSQINIFEQPYENKDDLMKKESYPIIDELISNYKESKCITYKANGDVKIEPDDHLMSILYDFLKKENKISFTEEFEIELEKQATNIIEESSDRRAKMDINYARDFSKGRINLKPRIKIKWKSMAFVEWIKIQ
jgi:DNA replication protein DnaC